MIAALLLGVEQAPAPSARFAPPIDRPLRVLIHQERTQTGTTRRYEVERRLVFRRTGTELIAEMMLVRVSQDVGGEAGRRFEAASGALKGRTIRFHLSADGGIAAIDDEAALWTATLAAIAAVAYPTKAAAAGSPAGVAGAPTALLAALPPERRRAVLASPLTAIIAGEAEDRTPGTGPVSISGNPVAGSVLTGTRTVAIGADQRLHVIIHARAADPAAPASLDRERVVDLATGLVPEADETQTLASGGTAQVVRQHVTITLW